MPKVKVSLALHLLFYKIEFLAILGILDHF